MPYAATPEFSKHSENLVEIRKTLTQLERVHKESIRSGHLETEFALRRVHAVTVGIFAEAVLRKIIADPHGFNQRERKAIWATRSQLDRWLLTVDLAFRRHNHILFHDELSINTLGDRFDRYVQIRTALERELKPLIEDRNKFAHGQWKHFLKSGKDDEFSREAPSPPTYTAIVAQYKATNAIAEMIHVLAVSDPAFQRDYDDHFRSFNDSVRRMQTDYYSEFVARLRARRGGRS